MWSGAGLGEVVLWKGGGEDCGGRPSTWQKPKTTGPESQKHAYKAAMRQ